jgi:hypothetical protein
LVTSGVLATFVACQPTPAATPRDPFVAPTYAGVTSCGPAIPPPPPAPDAHPLPAREPVPSFVAPRGDVVEPVIDGGLTPEPIDRQIKAHAAALRTCYLQLLAHDEHRGGFRVQVHFTIVADGSVAGIEVHGSEATMDRCLCDEFTAMRFPHLDARAVVTYPLIFSGGML